MTPRQDFVEISAGPDRALAAQLACGCPHNATAAGEVNVRQETEAARRKMGLTPGLTMRAAAQTSTAAREHATTTHEVKGAR